MTYLPINKYPPTTEKMSYIKIYSQTRAAPLIVTLFITRAPGMAPPERPWSIVDCPWTVSAPVVKMWTR